MAAFKIMLLSAYFEVYVALEIIRKKADSAFIRHKLCSHWEHLHLFFCQAPIAAVHISLRINIEQRQ